MAADEETAQARMKAEAAALICGAPSKSGWLEVHGSAPGVVTEWAPRWAQLSVSSFLLFERTEAGPFPARGAGAVPSCVVDMSRCVDIRNVPDTDEVQSSDGLEIHLDVATEPPRTWRLRVAWSEDAEDAPLGLKLSVRQAWKEALSIAAEEAQSWFKTGDAVIVKQPGRGGQYVPAVVHRFNGDGTCSVRYSIATERPLPSMPPPMPAADDGDAATAAEAGGGEGAEGGGGGERRAGGVLDQPPDANEGLIVVDCMCVRPRDLRMLLRATPADQLPDLIADFFESAAADERLLGGDGEGASSGVERRLVKYFAPFATEPVPCPAQEARDGKMVFAPPPDAQPASGSEGDSAMASLAIAAPPIGAAAAEMTRQLSTGAASLGALGAGLSSRFSRSASGRQLSDDK